MLGALAVPNGLEEFVETVRASAILGWTPPLPRHARRDRHILASRLDGVETDLMLLTVPEVVLVDEQLAREVKELIQLHPLPAVYRLTIRVRRRRKRVRCNALSGRARRKRQDKSKTVVHT